MFSLEQKSIIYKLLMLVFAFGGLMSLSFNVLLAHQYAHAVSIIVEHLRVIHKIEVDTGALKSHIEEEENRALNLTKKLETELGKEGKNESGGE